MSLRFLSALRTGFPLPHSGQATKATGRLHCYICNFSRVAQATLQCKSRIALFLAPFRDFLSVTTRPGSRNPTRPVERRRFLWESRLETRQIRLGSHFPIA